MLVEHSVPWEIDSAGVLMPPLADGVEADVPMLAGPKFDRLAGRHARAHRTKWIARSPGCTRFPIATFSSGLSCPRWTPATRI